MMVGGVATQIRDANGAPVVAQIIDGRTFLPVRAFASALGYEVDASAFTTTGVVTFTLAN